MKFCCDLAFVVVHAFFGVNFAFRNPDGVNFFTFCMYGMKSVLQRHNRKSGYKDHAARQHQ